MLKLLLILAVGVVIGYQYGWDDAQVNDKPVAERLLEQVGGKTRNAMRNDVDQQYRAVDK
jgi:predicted negative regulator of RcsB-dependent stress response